MMGGCEPSLWFWKFELFLMFIAYFEDYAENSSYLDESNFMFEYTSLESIERAIELSEFVNELSHLYMVSGDLRPVIVVTSSR